MTPPGTIPAAGLGVCELLGASVTAALARLAKPAMAESARGAGDEEPPQSWDMNFLPEGNAESHLKWHVCETWVWEDLLGVCLDRGEECPEFCLGWVPPSGEPCPSAPSVRRSVGDGVCASTREGGRSPSHSGQKGLTQCFSLPAFSQMGYNLSPQFSQLLLARYAQRSSNPSIQLDRFIQICMQLQSVTDAFREKDTGLVGNVRLSYEDFLTMVVTRMM